MASSSRIFEYFVVCGLGPEIRSLDMTKGFQGTGVMYMPSFLDQYPASNHSIYPPPPPQLPTCVLPAGIEIYSSGLDSNDLSTYPRSYPIVLTEGDGSKIYVSCIAFRDPICEDIAEAYRIPENSYADKCICLVSHSPSFQVLRDALEELFILCFSPTGSSKPLWEVIAYMVSNVPLPTPGKDRVMFAIENCLLSAEAPSKERLPHADISFQPLVQCLDVDNLIRLFTAVLLERRILLRSNKYTLLTLVSEAICHLIYPFRWQHVYIPLLFFSGVDYIDAPTPYMMGLHSDVDTSGLAIDGVVVVDLEHNSITTSEDIPSIPDPEFSFLRGEILKLLHPNVVGIDHMKINFGVISEQYAGCGRKPWGGEHDFQLRLIFLRFFASFLSGYRNFIEISATNVFNSQAFVKKRSRSTNQPIDSMTMITQFLDSQGFLDYLERCINSDENSNNLLDKLQDATGRGQNPTSIFPSALVEPEVITIAETDADDGGASHGEVAKYCYDRFPSNIRTEEQEEKRRSILTSVSGSGRHTISSPSVPNGMDPKAESLSPRERAAERERMVLDIKVKLQGLWLRLLRLGASEDPLSSFEYGTILALIESDAEGIGGSGFVECIREHIHSGWQCRLTDEQFIAVKELLKTAINRAISRNDMMTVRDALEVSAEMYRKDSSNVPDYVQRHLYSLSLWDELRFWDGYFEYLMDRSSNKLANYVSLVTAQLYLMAGHMVRLGLSDTDAWHIIETIAEKNNLGYKQLIKLRGLLSHMQQLRVGYWGPTGKAQSSLTYGLPSPRSQDAVDDSQQPAEASGLGRSWVQSMFSRDRSIRSNSFSRVRKWTSDGDGQATPEVGASPRKTELPTSGQKKLQSNVRVLKGHTGAVTTLHCVTRREVWDLFGDREDAGFFISGSTDCTVKIWDPSLRGSELRATLIGHSRPIRAISSDRSKVVSGSDDQTVIVWDKQTSQLLEELKGHNGPVSCVRMLSGERVLTASHDGTVKMWDVRTDTCVATVGRFSNAVLCMEYDDTTGILAAAGRDVVANIWDIRAGRQMQRLQGHTKWIRSIRMAGDTILTGSDDWTARMWSASRGTCDAVLACHAGPILCVEYSMSDKGIFTGSADGLIRFWEAEEGGIKCVRNLTLHSASILSINAAEHWLGVGAADNSMSLFHRPQERLGSFSSTGSKMAGWQLYRTPQRTVAMVRCVASDLDRKRICTGGRNGMLRLWEATINI
ncbi:DENN domain and WD repeat-containing protein SCD1 [Dioscorea cayenensis subsp. rotundata]|uniref:DENN domain and WD repeat-containing protein SCD1 n=1 Tax=Dioscorea cayennensis subsp. rotundata TaxID=55577 RepID=A0AB40CCN7_DIOCR|nr:DENN domain and WD repeat-containing protein SCD1 [Dioscorea cayenensis subsp. rotundata]